MNSENANALLPEAMNAFYLQFWGERWPRLLQALKGEDFQVARKNLFSDAVASEPRWQNTDIAGLPERQDLFQLPVVRGPENRRGPEGLLGFYIMDPASIFVAEALAVQPDDFVLDMCAAPGGKSLVLIEALARGPGEILLNELSEGRRDRLTKVIQQYVSREVRNRVHVTGRDGGKFALSHRERFDRILIDAPCSGERHLLENPKELAAWSEKRSKGLAQRQYALLTAGLEALKPGGRLVYSTCSVSQWENEGVVERFLKKKGDRVRLDPVQVESRGGEDVNGLGYFLPDHKGLGPLFLARFEKL